MSNTSDLRDGPYFIWSEGHTPLNLCGSPPEQPVVAFNDGGRGFNVRKINGPPNTYLLSEGHTSFIQDVTGNVVLDAKPNTQPQLWVITPHGEDKYTVVKEGTILAWTDPGGPAGCERELHLTELNPIRPEVLFEFRPIFE
ncbi:hypothetical protein SCLCIDRAFT_1210914 [Scleroderma citrinum Foug A]|uniref:Ricin B lectin domain-containing protein n=1 Tax=Scleroderma citrinum Foug A TaxID=1036808 RepID=A0A0C2ZZL7_9AGAM|nr:hypothetical protein SCLCIDRAFT_1210914 [Scleroderma citrinum Foug A]